MIDKNLFDDFWLFWLIVLSLSLCFLSPADCDSMVDWINEE